MKSSYELAMERLSKQSPTTKLTAEQKARLAELDSIYKAKIAERELFLNDRIAEATAKGDYEALTQLDKQRSSERRALTEECEEKKDLVRKGG
jgi:hypothetical protein